MRALGLLFVAGVALLQNGTAQAPPSYQPIATVSQIMLSMSYPMSDELLYIERNPPKTDSDWMKLQYAAVVMGESGNLLMMQRLGTPRDQEGWIKDCKLLVDAGAAALKAARARDMDAILALNDQIVTSCTTCHADYRPNYRRRPPAQSQQAQPQPAQPKQ